MATGQAPDVYQATVTLIQLNPAAGAEPHIIAASVPARRIEPERRRRGLYERRIKAVFDIAFGAALFVVLLPILAITALVGGQS